MRTLGGFILTVIFALFLSTTLAAPPAIPVVATKTQSIPACAASPTAFYSVGYKFWIQVVILEPFDDLGIQKNGFPLRIDRNYAYQGSERPYNRVLITRDDKTMDIFTLQGQVLKDSLGVAADLWPNSLRGFVDPASKAFSPLAFGDNPGLNPVESPYPLAFQIKKVCTNNKKTELQLLGIRADVKGSMLFSLLRFSSFPIFSLLLGGKRIPNRTLLT